MDTTLRSPVYTSAVPAARQDAEAVGKYTASFGVALALTSLFSAVLVIAKELNETTLLAWMKAATPHHWITHGIIDLALFVVLGFMLVGATQGLRDRPATILGIVAGGTVLGALTIAGFFLLH
jgi:hypothetical protein